MPLRGPVSVNHCTRANSEKLQVGPITIYIFEDGSRTDNRIGCILLELPAGASGPPMHWHRFHDECFFVAKGVVTFVTPEGNVDCGVGEMMTVPPRAIHTFQNASQEEEAEFFMTATPGYYMDYFRMMSKVTSEGKRLTPEQTNHIMELFGTFPPDVDSEP
ncbi:RmlC-like cupin domain-containing protein [Pseudomassariella vexata]|uniref:RmlC-like cupin domain-containing protein n=1 Tax=Pseudomassariella vexata TaxID=1141098 RepID=A0A1Y2DPR4_9PEZI|nr:RmlC-like cupin domain-containing protein [Pseudomassariella vexata]ORY61282.1 RmlC-like cupin domain-containing protein [Pseudomassariella vexata]